MNSMSYNATGRLSIPRSPGVDIHLTGPLTENSGMTGSMEIAWVYTLRRGLIVSAEFFQDHTEALEAAGVQQ